MGDENGDNFVKVTEIPSPFLDSPFRILGKQVIPMENLRNGMGVTERVTVSVTVSVTFPLPL